MPLGGLNVSLGAFNGAFSEGNLVSTGQLPIESISDSLLDGMNHVPCNLGFNIRMALFFVFANCLV